MCGCANKSHQRKLQFAHLFSASLGPALAFNGIWMYMTAMYGFFTLTCDLSSTLMVKLYNAAKTDMLWSEGTLLVVC